MPPHISDLFRSMHFATRSPPAAGGRKKKKKSRNYLKTQNGSVDGSRALKRTLSKPAGNCRGARAHSSSPGAGRRHRALMRPRERRPLSPASDSLVCHLRFQTNNPEREAAAAGSSPAPLAEPAAAAAHKRVSVFLGRIARRQQHSRVQRAHTGFGSVPFVVPAERAIFPHLYIKKKKRERKNKDRLIKEPRLP